MDFLLECVGFPPGYDLDHLVATVRAKGEPTAWRGPGGEHLRLPLGGGLEVHLDREDPLSGPGSLWPHFRSPQRLRVAVASLERVPDSPFDLLLHGTANPPAPEHDGFPDEQYPFSAHLTDAKRLPRDTPVGHVLAVSAAGFALDVTYVGPNGGVRDPAILDRPRGAYLAPLGGDGDPGGCMEVSLRVREVGHLANPLTGLGVELLETDAPGRPLTLFVSRWQIERDDLPAPRPGWRIEGTFLFTGRVAGGLPPAPLRVRSAFG